MVSEGPISRQWLPTTTGKTASLLPQKVCITRRIGSAAQSLETMCCRCYQRRLTLGEPVLQRRIKAESHQYTVGGRYRTFIRDSGPAIVTLSYP